MCVVASGPWSVSRRTERDVCKVCVVLSYGFFGGCGNGWQSWVWYCLFSISVFLGGCMPSNSSRS